MESFPSHIAINGVELMERVMEQVRHLGVAVDEAAEVERLDLAGRNADLCGDPAGSQAL